MKINLWCIKSWPPPVTEKTLFCCWFDLLLEAKMQPRCGLRSPATYYIYRHFIGRSESEQPRDRCEWRLYTELKGFWIQQSSSLLNVKAPQLSINKQNKEQDAGSWLCSLNKSPPTSPKNLKRWHCGAPLVCNWWPVRSVWCEWAEVEAGVLDSNMQWH